MAEVTTTSWALLQSSAPQPMQVRDYLFFSILSVPSSLLNQAKCRAPIRNAWTQLKTNGWPRSYRVLGTTTWPALSSSDPVGSAGGDAKVAPVWSLETVFEFRAIL